MDEIGRFFAHQMCKRATQYGLVPDLVRCILANDDYTGRLQDVANVILAIRNHLQDECMGFTAQRCPMGTFYYAARLGLSAGNLMGFLRECGSFYRVFLPSARYDFDIQGDTCTVKATTNNPELDPTGVFRLYMLMAAHRVSSWAIGRQIPLQRVCFEHPKIAELADYKKIFKCQVFFNHENNSMEFSRKYMQFNCVHNEATLLQYIDRIPLDVLTIPGNDFTFGSRIMQMLYADQVNLGAMTSLDNLAVEFHVSSQTLRRRLIQEGTSYRELKDTVRKNISLEKLKITGHSLADVASLAGFQETNSFFRAFKRWTGLSPSEYRLKYAP